MTSLPFVLLGLIPSVVLLRFCYNGQWHQTGTGKSCTLGIAFPRPAPIYCAYESDPALIARTSFQSDACIPKRFRVPDFERFKGSEIFAHNLPDLQVIYHHVPQDETDNSILNITKESPDVVDLNECIESCGATIEELDPSSSSSSEEAGAIDPQEVRALKEQTLRLGDYMYDITFGGEGDGNDGDDGSESIVQLDYRIVDLFKRSFDVIRGTCPDPFLPQEFNRRVMNGFLFLLSDFGTDKLQDITEEEYQDIRDAIDACKTEKPGFSFQGKICSAKALVERIIVSRENDGHSESYAFKQDDRLDYYKYDLFIDTAWKVVDIVHAVCFVQFHPNANMHHRYQTAMELLFTRPIHQRWQNPTKLINNDAWGSWFLVDINSTLLNLYACQRAAYIGTPFSMRLDRPFEKHRYRRDLSSQPQQQQQHYYDGTQSPSTKGGPNTEEYWEEYEASGGIQAKLHGQIYCFKNQGWIQGRNEILEQLQREQCRI